MSGCGGVRNGFLCSGGTQFLPDVCTSICGDGLKVGNENCDDASDDLAGCAPGCLSGSLSTWVCTGGSPTSASTCVPNCGDG
jgi:hypothetical protein